jgi:DNA-binding MarR family transcriptional regulator
MTKIKESRNPGSTAIKIKNEMNLLKALIIGEKSVHTLMEELKVSQQTIAVHIADLEKRGYIKQVAQEDRRLRVLKITSKGLVLLSELDFETKGKIFSVLVFSDIGRVFDNYFIFDARLPDNIFYELFDKFKDNKACLEKQDQENLIAGEIELIRQCRQALEALKLPTLPPLKYNLRPMFFEIISKTISDAIIYISIKALETGKDDLLDFLKALPALLMHQIARTGLSDEEVKKCLLNVSIFEDYYKKSQSITPERYKKVMVAFSGKNRKTLSEEEKKAMELITEKI